MDVSLFIARRLRFKGRIAMVSIAVSFFVMIISVSISSGFRHEIRDGISFLSGDVQLTPVNLNYLDESSPIGRHPAYLEHVEALDGVESVVPAVYKTGIIKTGDDIHGVIFKGVENPGTVAGADSLPPLGVAVPSGLASMLRIERGDTLLSYFIGERVRARKFKVASIYEPVADMEDVMVVYASLADMQRLNGWGEDEVSSMEILLKDRYRNVREMQAISDKVGFTIFSSASEDDDTVVASSAVESYPQLFDWLDLIDSNVLFIMVLMTVVAGFNMISGLLIMLFENISTIGLLKALGMTDMSIAKIFLASSSVIVLKGMAAGNLLAFAFCAVQGLTHFLALDPANYFVSFVPVHIDIGLVLLADLAAFCVIMLLLLIPSLFIAKVDPAKSVTVR